jgi:hypothetical protein
MTTTPITTDSIESLSQYLGALNSYRESLTRGELTESQHENRKYTALLNLAARAEACQRTSTLKWYDEEGRYVAPGAEDQTSALIATMLDHPHKKALFAEATAGDIVPLDDETRAILDEIASDFADHAEPIH